MKYRRIQILIQACVFFSIGASATTRAGAESKLVIPYPTELGVIQASTYDEKGRRVGGASLSIERLERGNVTLQVRSGFDGGAQQVVEAEFAPIEVDGKPMLRLLNERTQSFDPDGKPLAIQEIDHQRGEATCRSPNGTAKPSNTVELPRKDRVANVPLNLLFAPLVRGEVDRLDTQVFFCLGGARLMQFAARAVDVPSLGGDGGAPVRKVVYEPNVSVLYNWAAKALAPRILFWFEATEESKYLAHRLPLYTNGPVIFVIREGVSPEAVIESAKRDGKKS